MKLNASTFLRKCQHPLLMVAATFPLAILLAAHTAPEIYPLLPLYALLYTILAWACLLTPGRWRLLMAGAGSAIMLLFALLCLPLGQAKALLLLPAGYGALLFAALPVAGWAHDEEPHPFWHAFGFIAHLLLQFVSDAARRDQSSPYVPAEPWRMAAFFLFILLVMLAANRRSLHLAAHGRVRVPVQMRRQNVALTLGLLLLTILIASAPAVGRFLDTLWQSLLRLIGAITEWILSLLPDLRSSTTGAEAGLMGSLPPGETTDSGLLQAILEKIFMVLALLVAALLGVYFGRKLLAHLRRWLGLLWQHLAAFGSAASRDYVDEITDTRDGARHERSRLLQRVHSRLPHADERLMSPGQRVRYRYLRLRVKHMDWPSASTARETLPPGAAQLYERVRYGGDPATEAEADQFREQTRKV